jgi:hypothetical protein
MGRGSRQRLLDVLRNLKSYTLLCREHHLEFDMASWKLGEDPTTGVGDGAPAEEMVPF